MVANHLENVGEGGRGQGKDDCMSKRGRVTGESQEWHKRWRMVANHLECVGEVGEGGGGPEQRGLYVKTWESGRGNQEGLIGSAPGCPGFESDIIHSDPSICIYV